MRTQGETTRNGVVVETASWAVGIAGLLAALAGLVMYLVLTGAITRAVAAEVAGEDPSVEQSYRFGFHRLGSVLLEHPQENSSRAANSQLDGSITDDGMAGTATREPYRLPTSIRTPSTRSCRPNIARLSLTGGRLGDPMGHGEAVA